MSFTIDDIVSILGACAVLPGLDDFPVITLERCVPWLFAHVGDGIEPAQISALLSSIMHIYRDYWSDDELAVIDCLNDNHELPQYIHMPEKLAVRLVNSLKNRTHEPAELARIALGVARLCA